jgi:hypothetical protein
LAIVVTSLEELVDDVAGDQPLAAELDGAQFAAGDQVLYVLA